MTKRKQLVYALQELVEAKHGSLDLLTTAEMIVEILLPEEPKPAAEKLWESPSCMQKNHQACTGEWALRSCQCVCHGRPLPPERTLPPLETRLRCAIGVALGLTTEDDVAEVLLKALKDNR